jgi:acyl-CoA synthetase (AMP-forming)/AMP-acid ligase II
VTPVLPGGSQDFPLSLTHILGRARTLHRRAEVISLLDAEGTTRRATMAEVGARAEEGWLRITDRAVAEAAVIARPDERWSERPLACVVAGAEVSPAEVRDDLEPRVAKWWLPDDFAYLGEIPKTSVGKFDKKALRAMLATGRLPVRRGD